MTHSTIDKPELGDLVMDYGDDLGVISLIEPPTGGVPELYFVFWSSEGLTGYTTAHKLNEIRAWTINVRLRT